MKGVGKGWQSLPTFPSVLDVHPDFARGLLALLYQRLRESENRGSWHAVSNGDPPRVRSRP